jgi:hypothetical protein
MNKYVYTKEKGEKVKQRSTKHRKLEIQQPHYELGVNVGVHYELGVNVGVHYELGVNVGVHYELGVNVGAREW